MTRTNPTWRAGRRRRQKRHKAMAKDRAWRIRFRTAVKVYNAELREAVSGLPPRDSLLHEVIFGTP